MITVVERVPRKFLQHMEGSNGLYEVKVQLSSNIFPIFCCFDEGRLVVLFNGFQKKTQKTPKSEMEKAMKSGNENITTFEAHLVDKRYSKVGSIKRVEFEIKAKAFAIGEVIKEERFLANMTQEQLAEKTGAKKVSFQE